MAMMISLRSSDGEIFQVQRAAALVSPTLAFMLKDLEDDDGGDILIPLPHFTGVILMKVIVYCNQHSQVPVNEDDIRPFDADFVQVDIGTLCDLILASYYLNMMDLLDLVSRTVKNMVRGQTPDESREMFNVPDDFMPLPTPICDAERMRNFQGKCISI